MKEAEIVIVGGGPAGISAAATLVEAGYLPTLFDENPRVGGRIFRQPPPSISRSPKELYGFDAIRAAAFHHTAKHLSSFVEMIFDGTVFNVSPGTVTFERHGEIKTLSFTHLIIASGAMDRVLPFQGWTLPGVFTLGGSQALLKQQAAAIGEAPVFFGTGPLLYLVAYQYLKAGIDVRAVLDVSSFSSLIKALPGLATWPKQLLRGMYYRATLQQHGVQLCGSVARIAAAPGDTGSVGKVSWSRINGRDATIACDSLATGFNLSSQTQLADLMGCTFVFDESQRQWLPKTDQDGRSSVKGVYLAGDGARIGGAEMAELTGRLAAFALLVDLGLDTYRSRCTAVRKELKRRLTFRKTLDLKAFPFPSGFVNGAPEDLVVCRCENVTVGEIRRTVSQFGAQEINRSKAFCRIGMGRCQGRVCTTAAIEIIAAQLNIPARAVGRLRGQMPIKPLQLGTLAAGTDEL